MFATSIHFDVPNSLQTLKISSESGGIPSFIGIELTTVVSSCAIFMKQIPLTQGKFALVDDEDFEYLSQWKWYAVRVVRKNRNVFYAARAGKYTDHHLNARIWMHRVILKLIDPKIEGDHKDHNGLNNQRLNLRIATRKQNGKNRTTKGNGSSKYRGVVLIKEALQKTWRVWIKADGIKKYLGRYKNEEQAALAYDIAAKKLHGEWANLNFPHSIYISDNEGEIHDLTDKNL